MAKQTFTTGQVLTAAQMTSLQQTAMLGGAASAKTASYTLVAADAGTAISMSNASATTITVNTALFAAGDTVQITNLGAGVCTITAGTATVNTSASLALAQYESGTLDFTSTSAAIFIKGAGGAAASGGMTLLSTTTLSGASTTISVTPTGYNNLVVYVQGVSLTADDHFKLQYNTVTTTNYQSIRALAQTATSSIAAAVEASIFLSLFGVAGIGTGTANQFIIEFFNCNSSQTKIVQSYGYFDNSAKFTYNQTSTLGTNTAAITELKFFCPTTTMLGGTVLVYGVK